MVHNGKEKTIYISIITCSNHAVCVLPFNSVIWSGIAVVYGKCRRSNLSSCSYYNNDLYTIIAKVENLAKIFYLANIFGSKKSGISVELRMSLMIFWGESPSNSASAESITR